MKSKIIEELQSVLEIVVLEFGERLTGSLKNKEIAEYAKSYFKKNGYSVEEQIFSCIDWNEKGVELVCDGKKLSAEASYYSRGCQVEAEYVKLSTIDDLEKSFLENKIAVLFGELTAEQIMPKSFAFYNPEHHQKIINLLEKKNPAAIITVVDNDTSVFEDGDFDIPSVYVSKDVGKRIFKSESKIALTIKAERIPSTGSNIIARINENIDKKIVITAHLDTKYGTPGALDNGTGITILLLLSKLIKPETIDCCLELLLLNGEDYYSTPGQIKYMEEYLAKDNNIILAVNCDGVGLKNSKTATAKMGLQEENEMIINQLIAQREEFEIIDPWVEGDHMLFQMNNIATIALTSKNIFEMIDNIIHTEEDKLELVDYNKVNEAINFLEDLIKNYKVREVNNNEKGKNI
jgi:aminopeptidase YwaD